MENPDHLFLQPLCIKHESFGAIGSVPAFGMVIGVAEGGCAKAELSGRGGIDHLMRQVSS
jgi:hypothetical protein